MRDGTRNIGFVTALAPAIYAADANGVTIDRLNFDSVTFAIAIGAGGITFTNTNRVDFVMEHSDDGSAFDPVGADNVIGADATDGIVLTLNAAHADPTITRIGYVDGTEPDRRYVRLRPDFSGTHGTGTPISIAAILGDPRQSPVT